MHKTLPIGDLYPDPDQPRKSGMDDEDIADLAASVTAVGVIQTIRVSPDGKGKYKIVSGERRYRAAMKAGLIELPVCIDDDLTDFQRLEIQLAENMLRRDLSIRERADAIARFIKIHPDRQEAAKRLGISNGHLSQLLELTNLTPDVAALSEQKVTRDATTLVLVNQLAKKAPEKAQELIVQARTEGKLSRKAVVEALAPHRRHHRKKGESNAAPATTLQPSLQTNEPSPHLSSPSVVAVAPQSVVREEPTGTQDDRPLMRCPPRAKLKKLYSALSIRDDVDPAEVIEQLIDQYLSGVQTARRAA